MQQIGYVLERRPGTRTTTTGRGLNVNERVTGRHSILMS